MAPPARKPSPAQAPGPSGRAGRPGKRERLVASAQRLFYEQGVERTSIADIAGGADVPLGNVYYYFKTKRDLVDAVITAQVEAARAGFAALEASHEDPAVRLKVWFRQLTGQAESISRYGCPLGSLSTELEKLAQGADPLAAQLLQVPVDWAEGQFRAMGRRDAHELAVRMVAAYQGNAVLAHASGSPDLLRDEAGRIDRWIDEMGS